MKKIFFHFLLFVFCFTPIVLLAQKYAALQTKVFTKNYRVTPKDLLTINSNFTSISFQQWGKDEIEFITTVSLENSTEKELEQLLSRINISTNQAGNKTSYKLSLSKTGTKFNHWEINLVVKVPQDIFLIIETTHGDVEMANVWNNIEADVSFGNITIDNLFGKNNTIKIKHGNIKLEQANQLNLDAQFAEVKVKDIGNMNFISRFNTIKIDNAKYIDISSAHDNLSIRNSINRIEGKMEFGEVKIKSLQFSCVFKKFSFSNIKIEEVSRLFSKFLFQSEHSTLELNIPKDLSFKFDYSGSFTTFKDQKNIKLHDAIFEASGNSVEMSGLYGKEPTSGRTVKIQASFGTVSLFEK
jgi:hypothetical protein